MGVTGLDATTEAILAAVTGRLGLTGGDARVLGVHSNTIVALPSAGLVVRIAGNPHALPRVAASVMVTACLARQGFPCVRPADVPGQPFTVHGRAVSVWHHVTPVGGPAVTGAELGAVLRRLHDTPPPVPPPPLTDPLAGVDAALRAHHDALPAGDRAWLLRRIGHLRRRWRELDLPLPPALIHGDAHPGNVIRARDGVVLCDWDHVAVGPPEWDLVQLHYTHRRFGRPDRRELDGMAAAYGFDIAAWDGLDELVGVREVSGLSAFIRAATGNDAARRELAHRLRSLRAGDPRARWHPPRRVPPPAGGPGPRG